MMHYKDSVFSPEWGQFTRRIVILAFSLTIVGLAAWRFSQLESFNLLYIVILLLGILIQGLYPIYAERKELRRKLYRRHLSTLNIDILEKYLNQAESDIERDLIEDTISTIRY